MADKESENENAQTLCKHNWLFSRSISARHVEYVEENPLFCQLFLRVRINSLCCLKFFDFRRDYF